MNLGSKHTEESKKKMSEMNKGQIAWNKGKRGLYKTSEETKRKLSEIQKKIGNKPPHPSLYGLKPPSHKGKTYKEIYGDRWKKEINKRRESFMATMDKKGRSPNTRGKHMG